MAPNVFLRREAALEELGQVERDKAVAFAAEARVLAELDALYDGDSDLILEVSGTARVGQLKAAGRCERATRLVEHFPVALGLLGDGVLFVGTAELLLALTKSCSGRVQAEVDRRLSARVAGMNAVDARALVSSTVLEIEADLEREEQERRFAQARANRGVWVKPVEDGMARIGAEVDAVAAKEFALALDELDRAQKIEDDRCGVVRTKAQRMADLLVELPSRHLALVEALRAGRVEALLAQALGTAAATTPATTPATGASATGGAATGAGGARGPAELELPLDLPPAGPPRPWDLELDELVAALLRLPVRRPRRLNVHVAASTTLGLDDMSCVVEGLGPLPGWLARTLLPDAALRRILVDRATGLPLHLDDGGNDKHGDTVPRVVEVDPRPHRRPDDPPGPRPVRPDPPGSPPAADDRSPDDSTLGDSPLDPRAAQVMRDRRRLSALLLGPAVLPEAEPQYAPSARLRRLVQVRDLRCIGPGCSRSATACDLDHEDEFSNGGPTAAWNLSAKSVRCHGAKHDGWQAQRDRRTGVTTWTSPLGRVYTRLPAWRPPPSLPADTVLGAVPPPRPTQVETYYPEDRPLWPVPEPTTVTEPTGATDTAAVTPPDAATLLRPGRGWDDGTSPPF